ncbi:MAG: alkaline phosphatase [Muribaculaceae bacterium]|nr:alkaline phosphatase [Muribaculaceae bacterium]
MKLRHIFTAAALTLALAAGAQNPKYIFYYIGDGMGMGPVVAAETYNRTILKNDKPLTMMQMPIVGWCMTYSASSKVTDSAAAGTALSAGYKTVNGMLGVTPDTVAVTSIAKKLKDMGYGIGITTSCAPDDATPGAFYAHVPHRSMFYEIGTAMAGSGYEFFAGAGLRGLSKDGKDTDLLKKFADNKVQIVRGPEEIKNINSRKVLLLNPKGQYDWNDFSFAVDSVKDVLTLPLVAKTCLKHLEKTSPDKFFMMVEGGIIDHALHGNDGGTALREVLNFDEALKVAFEFYQQHPDETLIVVTADHDTGGMIMHSGNLGAVSFQKVSKGAFSEYCKAMVHSRMIYTWDDMRQYLTDNLGFFTHVKISEQQEAELKNMFEQVFDKRNEAKDEKTLYADFNAYAVKVFDIFNNAIGLSFSTGGHSGNPVPVFAVGVGAEKFKGFNNNVNIPTAIFDTVNGK